MFVFIIIGCMLRIKAVKGGGGRGELCEKKSMFVTCFTFIKCLQDRANLSV